MTTLDDILSRALLVPDRTVPRDTVPPRDTDLTARPAATPGRASGAAAAAAADLRALCETLVRHTPPTAVSAFVTDQIPEPRSALVLACVLQLTDTDDGARFWWQYAAGAGQPAAAYCLYLHHLALGETYTARWWHTQTNEVQTDKLKPHAPLVRTSICWDNDLVDPVVLHHEDSSSTTTILRVLRRLARHVSRPRSAVVTELMTYMPTAVAIGYLREPESELPLPGPGFARKIRALLAAAPNGPTAPATSRPAPTPAPPGGKTPTGPRRGSTTKSTGPRPADPTRSTAPPGPGGAGVCGCPSKNRTAVSQVGAVDGFGYNAGVRAHLADLLAQCRVGFDGHRPVEVLPRRRADDRARAVRPRRPGPCTARAPASAAAGTGPATLPDQSRVTLWPGRSLIPHAPASSPGRLAASTRKGTPPWTLTKLPN